MPSTRRMSVKKRNPSRLARRLLRSAQRFSNVGPLPAWSLKRFEATYRSPWSWPSVRTAVPTSLMMSAFARVTMGTRATVRRIARASRRAITGAPRMQEEKDAADMVGRSEVW